VDQSVAFLDSCHQKMTGSLQSQEERSGAVELGFKAARSAVSGLPYKPLAVRSAAGQALASSHLEAQAVEYPAFVSMAALVAADLEPSGF
jgi:hypothetical protein